MKSSRELFILSPFEMPDVNLALKTIDAGAYPVLHLGRNKSEAINNLDKLSKATTEPFGVCFVEEMSTTIKLPPNVDKIIYPFGMSLPYSEKTERFCQVHSMEEAQAAVKSGLKNLILKGNEATGKVAYESTFVLFQHAMEKFSGQNIQIYIQGGAGIHTSAATLALGAKGVVMDSQLALFKECSAPKELKNLCKSLSGNETMIIDHYRVLMRNNSPRLPVNAAFKNISPLLGGFDISKNFIPMGQDIALSIDLAENYKTLNNLVAGFHEARFGHFQQARKIQPIQPNNSLARELNMKYPVAQGPMARVSDVPEFAKNIADSGALPFVALSLARGEAAQKLLNETKEQLGSKTWGVGMLGFVPAPLREEQTKYILDAKPPVVLIAGGRPSLAKPFVKEGIKVFLHVPSPALLDMFLKEKSGNFIFEGRESGGHIGPLSSFVLWERQINRLLKEEELSSFNLFFAGGIHDAFSSAFISIMTATLAAKGAKIGVLMGSSYVYTKEAVKSGAILPEFQKQALTQNQTVILEASLGQETRALKSGFTDYFQQEKKRLQDQYSDSKEVWMRLEDLNLGRLRIAAKGIERNGNDLVKLNDKEQAEKGLYMMGQIAAMHHKILTLDELHEDVAVENNKLIGQLEDQPLPESNVKPLDVAVVGVSCIFPDARNTEEYWRNIITGKNSITEVPDSRWNKDLFYDPDTRDTDYVGSKWGGFIPTVDFDPLEFGMTPQSLASIEPTQLLSLLVAKRALTDAGYTNLEEVDLDNTSVIFGAEGATELAASYGFRATAKQVFGQLPENIKNSLPRLNEDSFAGVLSNVISGRIANRLNLGGRNYTVDAACASSLAALDLGCQELYSKRSDMVLLGGADLHNGINDFLMFACTHALSKKGSSASFDAESDGIALGEGVAVLVMKRLEDAERDGNKIYAVIKGIGGSSDGKSLGMTAPNRVGQMKALKRAYKSAGILPSQVGMIEAHGTGTVVGDRTELRALTDMFLESGAIKGQSLLGSVKTQIGHAKCAAGIAGIVKTVLSVYYGVHPPTLNLTKPNPYYDKESSPFVFNTQSGIWNDKNRIAGVSSFGFGGTNFHVVMENYKNQSEHASSMPLWPSELFIFRGDSVDEALKMMRNVKELLINNDNVSIKDLAYSLAVYNKKEVQVSVVATDGNDLLSKIAVALERKNSQGVYFRNKKDGKLAFMFSGQGSQRINMARDLFVNFPSMRNLLSQYPEYEKILFPYAAFDEETRKEQQATITDTRNAQPLLGIVDYAIADFLRSLGIIPDTVAGHSYGELPALCFAGVFAPENLVPLSRDRALSILNAIEKDKGKMIAVSLPEEKLNNLLQGESEVWAVNLNSHTQTVLAGSSAGITAFIQKLKQENIAAKELPVACAFHSPLLNKSKKLYTDVLKNVKFGKPSISVWSNTTAELYPLKDTEIKERLAEHLIKPVLFTKEVENMYQDGNTIFFEVGPGKVLTGLVQSILGDKAVAIDSENKSINGVCYLLQAIAKYMATGREIHIEKLFEGRNASVIDLEHPEKYQKKSTVWHINGHNAVPTNGKMPANGAYPITQPLMNLNNMSVNNQNNNNNPSDQVVLEYLHSMRTMLQSQHDVMMRYMGYNPQNGSIPISQTVYQPVQQIPVAQVAQTAPVQQAVVVGTRPSAPVSSAAPAPSLENVKAVLLEIVSEKTGYPEDMLGLDLDLEADLSIDSIKRMEIIGALRDKLNISGSLEDSEDAIEKMAAVKTLNGLIDWIKDLAQSSSPGQAPQNPAPAVAATPAAVTAPASQPAGVSIEDIKALLLETVSEKTGYPEDMLGLDLDLEADLSIDSIKRMEIIGALRDKLNISGSLEDSEDAIEKMAAVKTLNGLIDWMADLANSGNNPESAPVQSDGQKAVSETPAKANPETADEKPARMAFELEEQAIKSQSVSLEGKRFALTNDGGTYVTKVKSELEKKGVSVDLVDAGEDLSAYDGLIILDASQSKEKCDILKAFDLIKSADLTKIKWIYTFSDSLGVMETGEAVAPLKKVQGFPGMIKTLAHEFPETNFRVVTSFSLFDKKSFAQLVVDELTSDDTSHREIVYKNGKRYCIVPKMKELQSKDLNNLSLDKDSVIVVFGGAQGITPDLVTELSKEYPCNYVLVGRSEKPSAEFDRYQSLETKDEIRKYLLTEEKMKNPAEIEKKVQKIFKVNQINANITKIEKTGAKVTYESLDIRDTKALKQLLKNVRKQYGKIDGIFHAAGLLEDKLFTQKTIDSFEKVYTTKVTPLHVILDEIGTDIKLLVLFSSVASAYGNKGQIDYASGNSVFDLVTPVLNDKTKVRVLTINWGPWKGSGMVSDSLEAEFKKRGVSLISLKAGAKYFVEELKYGNEGQVLVMGGAGDVKNFLKG